jgi:hypothetical protein
MTMRMLDVETVMQQFQTLIAKEPTPVPLKREYEAQGRTNPKVAECFTSPATR